LRMSVPFFEALFSRVVTVAVFSIQVPVPIETVKLHWTRRYTGLDHSSFF
jgi:hypothetical protein